MKIMMEQDYPNVSRMYDYWLGGYHNLDIDRRYCDRLTQIFPCVADLIRMKREFLERCIEFYIHNGIEQVLDICSFMTNGYGICQIVNSLSSEVRVVYADNDPVTIDHCEQSFAHFDNAMVVQADINNPYQVINNSRIVNFFDLRKPVGIVISSEIPIFSTIFKARSFIRSLMQVAAKNSYLALTHCTGEDINQELSSQYHLFANYAPFPVHFRSRKDIILLFGDLELIPPGLVSLPLWKPDGMLTISEELLHSCPILAGVARN